MTLNDLEEKLRSGNYNLYITDMLTDDNIWDIADIENKTGTEIFDEIGYAPEFVLFKTLNEKKLTVYIKDKYSLAEVFSVYVVKDGLIVSLEVNEND